MSHFFNAKTGLSFSSSKTKPLASSCSSRDLGLWHCVKAPLPACLLGLLFLLQACQNSTESYYAKSQDSEKQASKEIQIETTAKKSARTLTVATRESLHTFVTKPTNDDHGLEFSLIKRFAESKGLKLNIILAQTETELFQAIDDGHAHIALLGQPLSRRQAHEYEVTSSYMDVTTQLIYRHGNGKPKSFEELSGKRILIQDLEHLKDKFHIISEQYPDMNWQFTEHSPATLMKQVNNGEADFALVGSHEFLELAAKYPRTRVAFDLYYPEGLSLLLSNTSTLELNSNTNNPKNISNKLIDELDLFIESSMQTGIISHLQERYLGHQDDINPRGSLTFFRRINQRLPHYQDLIENVASDYEIDWRLLAAIAYQESHWNPNAKSPTGVRGMMMLTQKTAADLGIENRLDLSQSLNGGAHYFTSIRARLPEGIQEPDRTWFALAAYNVGLGHIYDARKITEFHGGNPDHWADVKQYLPLLEDKAWYQYTRHGFARGQEPVNYVQNIRHFHDLLEWRFPSKAVSREPTQISVKDVQDVIKEARNSTDDNSNKLSSLSDNSWISNKS